jgi:hypothetical protein
VYGYERHTLHCDVGYHMLFGPGVAQFGVVVCVWGGEVDSGTRTTGTVLLCCAIVSAGVSRCRVLRGIHAWLCAS